MNRLMPYTTTVTELQRHFKKVAHRVKRSKRPITIMSQNRPSMVLMDYGDYKKTKPPKLQDPYGILSDSTLTDKDIDDVISQWDRHVDKLVDEL